jgi:ABC-type uncharacterized transport system permease subunit
VTALRLFVLVWGSLLTGAVGGYLHTHMEPSFGRVMVDGILVCCWLLVYAGARRIR